MMRLAIATGDGVATLDADGREWRATLELVEPGAASVAADPAGGAVYAGCRDGGGVWRRDGDGWRALPFPSRDVHSVAVSAADGTVYAGCEPSALWASADAGEAWRELAALRALPSAPTWSFPPRPWTSHVRTIAPSPLEPGLVLVGIELGGVMRTTDGGQTFADHRPGAQPDAHWLAWHPRAPGRAYEAGGGGSAWSSDGGDTWSGADAGRDRHYTWALAIDPDDPDRWYVSASPGPFQAHRAGRAAAAIYRWRGDGPWERLTGGLPDPLTVMPYALAAAGGVLVAGLADGTLLASDDGGDSWRRPDVTGDPMRAITAIAVVDDGR
jgi:photosystem II stability/assembly factor-like uncharacterized protein